MNWSTWLCLFFILCCSQSINPSFSKSSSPSPSCQIGDSIALLQFKNSLNVTNNYYFGCSDPKQIIQSWENGTNCCTWSGVTCEKLTGHVIGLDVSCSLLQGILHSNNSLFSLNHLQSLNLSGNKFDGSSISSEFGKLTHLTHLDLSYSGFFGHVPSQIAYLSKLVTLDLSSSNYLQLETSSLKRIVQNLTHLRELTLSDTDMYFVLPVAFLNLSSSLTSLHLSDTYFHGKFPENIFHLPNLQQLYLGDNLDLAGSFPKSNWSSPLMELDLSFTNFSIDLAHLTNNSKNLNTLLLRNCSFIGSYPTVLGNFTQVISLDLSQNNFGGEFPWSSLNLERISSLQLSYNNFVGEIPQINGNAVLHLTDVILYDNKFNGTLPSWLYASPSLQNLLLAGNQFTGFIGEVLRSVSQNLDLRYLDLSQNNFSGVIEFNQFSKLKNLWYLDLSFNNFSLSSTDSINYTLPRLEYLILSRCNIQQFPPFLKALENLAALDLSHNQIQGKVPKWFENVGKSSLHYLNVSYNSLRGIDQLTSWENIFLLDLQSNLLHGNLPIPSPSTLVFSIANNRLSGELPSSICKLINQTLILDLSNNSLNGTIPRCIGIDFSRIEVLNLRLNGFHGMIPSTFAWSSLRSLDFNGNQLDGPLPQSLEKCKSLEILDVGNNKISDTFPHWVETLPKLKVLILRSNKFHGPIGDPKYPDGWFPFRYLQIIDLSYNEFNGPLPSKYFGSMRAMMDSNSDTLKYLGQVFFNTTKYYHDLANVVLKGQPFELTKIQTIFTMIDFSENNFEGKIPKIIGNLKALKGLNFSHNKLIGGIPTSMANLTNLEWLDLSSNRLVGEIPKQLTDLTSLQVLNLSKNHLVGAIPGGKQFNTFENDSYSGNPGLCGFPLSKACRNDTNQPQVPSSTVTLKKDDSMFATLFDWKFALAGFGSGLVFGISMGYVMLSDKIIYQLVEKYFGGSWHKSRKRPKKNARIGRRNH